MDILKQKYISLGLVLILAPMLLNCGGTATKKTSLELQAFQSHEFDASKEVAFASTMSVFQDLGYVIEAGNVETGLITAKSPTVAGFVIFVGQTQTYTKATAFVEMAPRSMSKVRLNFVEIKKTSSGYGMAGGEDKPIEDPAVYQNAFAKIQEAIFIRQSIK